MSESRHSREKRPMATRGRESPEAAPANHSGGVGKSNRAEAVIGCSAARGLSFFPEPPSVFVGVWRAEGVRFPPGMRLCESGSCSQSPQNRDFVGIYGFQSGFIWCRKWFVRNTDRSAGPEI